MNTMQKYKLAAGYALEAFDAAVSKPGEASGTVVCRLCGGSWGGALGWSHRPHCKATLAERLFAEAQASERNETAAHTMAAMI